jgi:hypothetical protein
MRNNFFMAFGFGDHLKFQHFAVGCYEGELNSDCGAIPTMNLRQEISEFSGNENSVGLG